jgi:hypothetical protein
LGSGRVGSSHVRSGTAVGLRARTAATPRTSTRWPSGLHSPARREGRRVRPVAATVQGLRSRHRSRGGGLVLSGWALLASRPQKKIERIVSTITRTIVGSQGCHFDSSSRRPLPRLRFLAMPASPLVPCVLWDQRKTWGWSYGLTGTTGYYSQRYWSSGNSLNRVMCSKLTLLCERFSSTGLNWTSVASALLLQQLVLLPHQPVLPLRYPLRQSGRAVCMPKMSSALLGTGWSACGRSCSIRVRRPLASPRETAR